MLEKSNEMLRCMYIFLGKNPLNLFSLMTLSHFLRVGATVLSATPQLGKEGGLSTDCACFFPWGRHWKTCCTGQSYLNSRSLNPRGKSVCALDTDSPVQLGFHSRNGEKADEKQLQPFASFKNKKINPMRPAGVSEPSQSPFWPFIVRFIALEAHETLLKVVHFNI